MNNTMDTLARSLLFSGLPAEQLGQIADIAVTRKFARNAAVFHEGDPGIGFYMVTAGKVKIYKMSPDGKEQILHIFGPGEPFGEVPVFHGNPFPANASTLTEAELLFFPRPAFVELITRTPSLALNMLAVLAQRLRRFATQIENLSLKEVPGRLASYLGYLAEEQGYPDRVVLDIPKGQLASLLGASSETLSRIFARMTDEGLIRVEGRTIHLLDQAALRER